MCEEYTPCICLTPKRPAHKDLTLLLLDCWQREYDKRPYRNFKLKLIEFEERMERNFNILQDFEIVVRFLQQRPLCGAYLSGIRLSPHHHNLLQDFAESLVHLRSIELKLMDLPTEFFELLQTNCSRMHVKELSFEGTVLNTEDVTALQAFCIESPTLRSLNVASCSINQYNFALLADGVHKSTSLRNFNCSRLLGNTLTLDSMKIAHIVSSLIWQNKLEELVMQQCEFISSDMETIAEYLHNKCSKMLKLNLSYNLIGPDGAEYLFRAISHSGTLTHLDICGNGLGSHGGEVVAKYLSACYRLEYLDITYNAIGHEAMNTILTTMKKSIKLMKLKVYGNQFNQKSANILRRLLDARVVPQDTIDITITFDETLLDYRVIPYF